ncbi:MAG: PEP-utilizing enzyme [Actinomycetota bacterium]|nr:PEP-utilizing enzyme [Actinomycetota bacterium]
MVAQHPVVLALVPPHVQPAAALPTVDGSPPLPSRPGTDEGDGAAVLREALRLRVRWVQELTARAAWVIGERLARQGSLAEPGIVRDLRLEDVRALVGGRAEPWLFAPASADGPAPEPLPARFRLSDRGQPVAVVSAGQQAGSGAGGGVGVGPVHHGPDPDEGAVLVVRTLDPGLATTLPRLAGLVAETGSVLAHVAILAREAGVPTVVGLPGATERFPPGTLVRVDGSTGEVAAVTEEEV